ncbi:MAG: TonB-dependent siderophore receptor [Neisseriaceae bacterium]|nr:TonB-dependent siderophore receptor [Neisseriaceae bacterium]
MRPTPFRRLPLMLALLPLSLHAETAQDSAELDTIVVQGQRNSTLSRGYTTDGTHTPIGLPMTLREIPQSISVITEQQLQDQNIKTLDRALLQATGVSQQIWGSNRGGYNYLFARGSQINNFWLDGLPQGGAFQDVGNATASVYERVEVIRGVSGLMDGSGEPGATVNLVRKRPTAEPLAEMALSGGSHSRYGFSADLSNKLNASGSLRGRTVLSIEDGDTWRDREHERAASLYGILEYDISPDTQVSAGLHVQYAKEKPSASHSASAYDNEGYATHFGPHDNPSADWSYSRTQSQNLFVGLKHRFNSDWKANVEYSYSRSHWFQPYGVAGILSIDHHSGATDMITGQWDRAPQTHSFNVSLTGKYDLFGRKHDVIMGMNSYRHRNEGLGGRSLGTVDNVYDFIKDGHYPQPSKLMQTFPRNDRQRQLGGYAATRLYPLDGLAIILGGRYSSTEYGSLDSKTNGLTVSKKSRFTPYAGIVYDFNDTFSTYASYSSLFVPQTQKDIDDAYLKPIVGSNIEAGLKAELFDGALNASAAIYQTRKENMAVAAGRNDFGDTYYKAVDEAKTHGWEVDIGGNLTPSWQIQAGYSQSLSRDGDDNRLNTEAIPRHTVKLFTSYQLPSSASAWTIGGGMRWQSETYSTTLLSRVNSPEAGERALANARQKAYAVVDLMARYQINPNAELTLNVDNLFNKQYRTQPDRISYGALRSVSGTVRYRF